MSFAYALLALNLLTSRQVPPGAQLHIRLTSPVGSYASRAGDPVSAVLIAPLISNGQTILPAGSLLSGKLKSVQRVGLGFIHEMAALDLEFTAITPPNGESVVLSSRVQEVDNGRETTTREGSIRGNRPTSSLSYRAGGYIRTALQWEFDAQIAVWAIKMLLLQVPEPELYYPAGVELTLILTRPIAMRLSNDTEPTTTPLSGDERLSMAALVAEVPARTHTTITNRPSDLINVMFIGSRDDLTGAFEAAGWVQPKPATMRTNIRRIRAVADGRGDSTAPMSDLLILDNKADMSWQKSFNDVSKRHHIRIWQQPGAWNGQRIWIGAATRDIDFAYWRPGWAMTHKIAENVDQERDKVANDLIFTGCAGLLEQSKRPDVPVLTQNATGDSMRTDTRLAIVHMNRCDSPKNVLNTASATLPRHGSKFHRFVRREVLSFRSDILRENIYWRSYEGLRWMIMAYRQRGGKPAENDARSISAQELGQSSSRSSFVTDMFR